MVKHFARSFVIEITNTNVIIPCFCVIFLCLGAVFGQNKRKLVVRKGFLRAKKGRKVGFGIVRKGGARCRRTLPKRDSPPL